MEFEQFVHERLPALLRFMTAVCADRFTAEDVLQEVLVRVHQRWEHVGGLEAPEMYVRKAAVNEYLSWRRKWARVLPQADFPDTGSSPDVSEQVALRSALEQRLATLPPRQRAVLVMRYWADLSDGDIAQALGCQPATVRGYAKRGLSALRVDVTDGGADAAARDSSHDLTRGRITRREAR